MAVFSIQGETLALLQGQPAAGGLMQMLLLWIPLLLIFYLLLFVPQQRQRKRLQQMQNELKAGDKVITSSGIYGTIVGVEDDAVQLRIAEQVKIRISRQSIAMLQPEPKES